MFLETHRSVVHASWTFSDTFRIPGGSQGGKKRQNTPAALKAVRARRSHNGKVFDI